MYMRCALLIPVFILLACTDVTPEPVQDIDPEVSDYIWPFCGYSETVLPAGWTTEDGCPLERQNANFHDTAISSTFGPRLKASESFRYDYHRGIDIPAPINSPLFAIADGVVLKAGADAAFADNIIVLRHYDFDGERMINCDQEECLHSVYVHLNDWAVNVGDIVKKGQFIGLSGASISGFPHLHFEIRQAPGEHDHWSYWQRDSVHPLAFLPIPETTDTHIAVTIADVNTTDALAPEVTVAVSIAHSIALTLNRIELMLYARQTDGSLIAIEQTQSELFGETPEGSAYHKYPQFFDMNVFTRQFSYKDSATYPFSAFQQGGRYESPFAEQLIGQSYSANIHLDNASVNDASQGEFNGLLIAPAAYNNAMERYEFQVIFTRLTGVMDPIELCVQARALDVFNVPTDWAKLNCD